MLSFYNEKDPAAAAWLRELVNRGLIAPGIVDERSIEDIRPSDLHGFTQCHFFAGIGAWSHALRLAGWADDRRVWTGSCPCQPFSQAGRGDGLADERHLWPAWFHLITQCRPDVVFGEQVASRDGLHWFDVVHHDLEAAEYAVGAADLSAASVGAPHIRQRLYFAAHANGCRPAGVSGVVRRPKEVRADGGGASGRMANDGASGLLQLSTPRVHVEGQSGDDVAGCGPLGGLGNASASGLPDAKPSTVLGARGWAEGGAAQQPGRSFWSDVEWLICRDGSYRPTEPGTFPLVDGAPARMVRLRGYGNAIVAPLAAEFIKASGVL